MDDGSAYEVGDGSFGLNAYLYSSLYNIVSRHGRNLAKCVPDFIINESLRYFEKREQYEKCQAIKSFFDKNPKRRFAMSRNDWMDYGWQTRSFKH